MFKKFLIGFLIFFVLLVGAIVTIPFVFKDKINAKIKEQINKELLADVAYSSYDLSILRSFPDLFFTLEDLIIVGRGDFAGDTLAKVKEVGLDLELMKVIRGEELQINGILIDEANFLAYKLINEAGDTVSNYDILPPTNSESANRSLIDINVEDFVIKNSNIYFVDGSSGMEFHLKNINSVSEIKYINEKADVKSNFSLGSLDYKDLNSGMQVFFEALNSTATIAYSEEFATLNAKSDFGALSYFDGSSQLLKTAKLVTDLNIEADLINSIYAFSNTEIAINALKIYLEGVVGFPNDQTTSIDLKFNADKSSFKELLSLIPAEYLKDYEGLKASGNFTLNGLVKGDLSDTETPTFDINLMIENGVVQYPDLPSAVENINLSLNVKNTTSNIENTSVTIPQASLKVAEETVTFSLKADNVLDDPFVDLRAKGKLDLKRVPEFYPIEGVTRIGGLINAAISFKGLLSAVEKEEYGNIDFGGTLLIDDLLYDAADLPLPVSVKKMSLKFSPRDADLIADGIVLGKSDFNATGRLENIINYVLSDGTVKGSLNLTSKHINLDELLGDDTADSEVSSSTATKVPDKIDFQTQLSAAEVLYDGLLIKNIYGALAVKDERLELKKLSADMLGGTAKINGTYSTKNTEKPEIALTYDIQNFDIQQSFTYFNTAKAIAPLAKYLTGSFSTDMSLTSLLNNDLSLDFAMLKGLGKITVPYASFTELPMFNKIRETLKLPTFDKPALNNAWTILKFEDGQVKVEPFQIKMKDIVMDMEGTNSFDQTINYEVKMSVPSDKFGGAASLANDFLSKQKIPLLNLSVPQILNFHLNVSGAMTNPVVKIVKITTGDGDKGIKDQLKDQVQEQFNQVKDDLTIKAKEEADKAKAQAQAEVDKAKAQAQAEAAKVKQKAQEEIEKAKDDIKENVKDKIKGFKW